MGINVASLSEVISRLMLTSDSEPYRSRPFPFCITLVLRPYPSLHPRHLTLSLGYSVFSPGCCYLLSRCPSTGTATLTALTSPHKGCKCITFRSRYMMGTERTGLQTHVWKLCSPTIAQPTARHEGARGEDGFCNGRQPPHRHAVRQQRPLSLGPWLNTPPAVEDTEEKGRRMEEEEKQGDEESAAERGERRAQSACPPSPSSSSTRALRNHLVT
ncbi:hypothetical protein DPEC_G00074400 [Dallia pectoralis]|uniref:Uncharacterized protein n=1 Tax=Dallia pectoralis TaxID=75939 RepID=A0ACC2H319_DALPE|nr:hypothetical protein DPEC_G00074400 [Dallia pectoralis]